MVSQPASNLMSLKDSISRAVTFAACLTLAATGISVEINALPLEVSVIEFGHGTRLTDSDGFTLYQYDGDLKEPGSSTCVDDCAVQYPPLLASGVPEQHSPEWERINRDDGTQQWAYQGRPLYRFARDSHKGAAFGEGGGWTIAFDPILTPPEMSINKTVLGHVLASPNGLTLYTPGNGETPYSFECQGNCLETWLPLEAPWSAVGSGDFTVYARVDGIYQWTHKGRPLYLYAKDSAPGEVGGDRVENFWSALVLEPALPNPAWVQVVGSDGGKLYANSDGMTLYTLNENNNNDPLQALGSNVCDPQCLSDGWQPVQAQSMTPPVGKWSVIQTKDEALQWAYLGMPLFTSKNETRPGQLIATTRREYQWLKPIMYALPALQGVFN